MTSVLVAFDDVWLTDVADPTVSVQASSPEREETAHLDGEVRFYAGGRRRVITSMSDARTYPLTLQWLTPADVDQLRSWRGRVLLLRDSLGRRVFGTFLAVEVADRYIVGGWRSVVTLTFTELSYTEGV